MWKSVLVILATVAIMSGTASADSLYGTIRFKDGSKDQGTTRITQSWNGKKPKLDGKGNYKLDFGDKVGKKITIYVNGSRYTEVEVKGETELNIIVP